MEPTERDRELAQSLRMGHQWAVTRASEGRLTEVLSVSREHPAVTTYVVKLLDVTPDVGKVKGRRLLHDLSIGEFTRVCDLTETQCCAILGAVASLAGVNIGDDVDGVMSR